MGPCSQKGTHSVMLLGRLALCHTLLLGRPCPAFFPAPIGLQPTVLSGYQHLTLQSSDGENICSGKPQTTCDHWALRRPKNDDDKGVTPGCAGHKDGPRLPQGWWEQRKVNRHTCVWAKDSELTKDTFPTYSSCKHLRHHRVAWCSKTFLYSAGKNSWGISQNIQCQEISALGPSRMTQQAKALAVPGFDAQNPQNGRRGQTPQICHLTFRYTVAQAATRTTYLI